MDNSFLSQEYMETGISEILLLPEVQKVIQHPSRVWVNPDRRSTRYLYDEEYLFKSWLTGQFERYVRVYDTIAPYFRKEGRILLAEPKDFLKWYVNNAIAKGDYLSEMIEAADFNLYHEEKVKTLNKTNKWDDLYKELSENKYIITTPEVFNYVLENKHLPAGKEKIHWRTAKADTWAFIEIFNFTRAQLNECFSSNNGREFTWGSRSKKLIKHPLKNIIDRYKPEPDNK